jgi:hypothetical protein
MLTQEIVTRLCRLEDLRGEDRVQLAPGQDPLGARLLAILDHLMARTHALELTSQRLDRVTTALSNQAEAITEQQMVFQHDVRFRQRWLTPPALPAVRSSSSGRLRLPTIGVISTWNSRCGIAAYAQSLLSGIDPARLRVFGSKVAEALHADESGTIRWTSFSRRSGRRMSMRWCCSSISVSFDRQHCSGCSSGCMGKAF